MNNKKVLLIGLDGVTWDIIRPLIKKGYMKNLKKIIDGGTSGVLESVIPPVTPPAWTSISTGCVPEKHGILDFYKIVIENNEIKYNLYNSKSKKVAEIWDFLPYKSIICNVPLTYPPKKINGIMISGMYTPNIQSRFTYPDKYKYNILNNIPNYIIDVNWSDYKHNPKKFINKLNEMTERRIELFWKLFNEKWNFFYFVFVGFDRLQHIYYENKSITEYYSKFDIFLGELLDKIQDINTIFVSDHGFCQLEKIVNPNTILYDMGYLKKTKKNFAFLNKIGINKDNIYLLINKIGLHKLYTKISKGKFNKVKQIIPGNSNIELDFDIKNSQAIILGTGELFILDKKNEISIKSNIITEFKKIKNNRKNVFKKIYELKNPSTYDPSIILVPEKGYSIGTKISKNIFEEPDKYQGDHALEGIFIGKGPNINTSKKVNCSLIDITPTILKIFNISKPKYMDGIVLNDALVNVNEEKDIQINNEKIKIKNILRNINF